MKSKALEKAVATAREQAQILDDKAKQSGRAARAAKDRLRQAKAALKQAREEVNLARKAAKAAKRACAKATDAAEDAAAMVAALEKRLPAPEAAATPSGAKSRKPRNTIARKRASTRRRRGAATATSKKVKVPSEPEVPFESITVPLLAAIQPDPGSMEVHIQMSSDIAVPTDVFSGSPAQSDGVTVSVPETSNP